MHLTPEALSQFEKIWLDDHPGEHIAPDRLLELATRTVQAVELVYRAIPLERLEKFRAITDSNSGYESKS